MSALPKLRPLYREGPLPKVVYDRLAVRADLYDRVTAKLLRRYNPSQVGIAIQLYTRECGCERCNACLVALAALGIPHENQS